MFALRRCTPFDDATATVRRIGLILLACSILSRAESARGAASYSITLQGSSQTSASPATELPHGHSGGLAYPSFTLPGEFPVGLPRFSWTG